MSIISTTARTVMSNNRKCPRPMKNLGAFTRYDMLIIYRLELFYSRFLFLISIILHIPVSKLLQPFLNRCLRLESDRLLQSVCGGVRSRYVPGLERLEYFIKNNLAAQSMT